MEKCMSCNSLNFNEKMQQVKLKIDFIHDTFPIKAVTDCASELKIIFSFTRLKDKNTRRRHMVTRKPRRSTIIAV